MEEKIRIYDEKIPMLIMKKIIGITKEQYFVWNDFIKEMVFRYPRLSLPMINELFGQNYSMDEGVKVFLQNTLSNKVPDTEIWKQDVNITVEYYTGFYAEIKVNDTMYCVKTEFLEGKYDSRDYISSKQNYIRLILDEKINRLDKITQAVVLYVNYVPFRREERTGLIEICNGFCDNILIKRVQEFSLSEIRKKHLYFLGFMIPVRVYSEMNPYFWSVDAKILVQNLKECILLLKEAVRYGCISEKESKKIMVQFEAVCMEMFGTDAMIKEMWQEIKSKS